MVYKSLLLVVFTLLTFASADDPIPATYTCAMHQNCDRPEGYPDFLPCPDVNKKKNPVVERSEPGILSASDQSSLQKVCPYLDGKLPLCCNGDQVALMVANFQQIDSVFGGDGPLCAVNLKKLWCEYGCNSRSYTFIRGTGYLMQDLNGIMTNFTKVVFTMDDEMACTMFKSCNKVSMIAQASIQSSLAFLDFMGVNGQNQSLSVMQFVLKKAIHDKREDFLTMCQNREALNDTTSGEQVEITVNTDRLADLAELSQEVEKVGDDVVPDEPLYIDMHNCYEPVPEDGIVDGYPDVKAGKCTFCSELCEPPTIDSSIGFFDGFDGKTVGATYAVLTAFTILWQIYQCVCARPRIEKEHAAMKQEQMIGGTAAGVVNKTGSASDMNLYS